MRFRLIRPLVSFIPIVAVLLLVLSGCQHQARSHLSAGVLNFGDLRIPASHKIAVDGSLRHNEIGFVLTPELRSSTRYSSITLFKSENRDELHHSGKSTTVKLCGLDAWVWSPEDRGDGPVVWGVFFNASEVFVSVTALSREEALSITRYMLGAKCDEHA